MAVILYFAIIIGVISVGSAIVAVTFYQWLKKIDRNPQHENRQGDV